MSESPMPITWSTRFTLEQKEDKLVIRGKIPSVLWPTTASTLMAFVVTLMAFDRRFADSPINPLVVCLLGSIWFSAIIFGLWLTVYFSFRKPVVLDPSANQVLRGTSPLCPLSDIGWVEFFRPKDNDYATWVSLCRVGSGKRIRSFVPIGDAEAFATALARFLRVERRTTEEW